MNPSTYRLSVFTTTAIGGHSGHEIGDYLIQSDHDARNKQCHTRPDVPISDDDHRSPCQRVRDGHVSLGRHGLTYGLAQMVTKALAYRVAGVEVPFAAQLAGTLAEAGFHVVVDDGRLLRKFAAATNKLGFHDLNAGGVNGRMLLDQATHKGLQLMVGAAVTTGVAAWLRRKR
ncbi:hypothetical protein [Saccharopolyspora shandongensis]|uniref:hypothetical protein n=1 Tax=Saccharopolyspora shandongensis TaxID=418495 RepID=UPI0033E14C42